jgi:hypothetical protein
MMTSTMLRMPLLAEMGTPQEAVVFTVEVIAEVVNREAK